MSVKVFILPQSLLAKASYEVSRSIPQLSFLFCVRYLHMVAWLVFHKLEYSKGIPTNPILFQGYMSLEPVLKVQEEWIQLLLKTVKIRKLACKTNMKNKTKSPSFWMIIALEGGTESIAQQLENNCSSNWLNRLKKLRNCLPRIICVMSLFCSIRFRKVHFLLICLKN